MAAFRPGGRLSTRLHTLNSATDAIAEPGPGSPFDAAWVQAWQEAYLGDKAWVSPFGLAESRVDGCALTLAWARQRLGPLAVTAIGGWYWPARGLGSLGAAPTPRALSELAEKLHDQLGWPLLRLGPVVDDDAATAALLATLRAHGFADWRRELGVTMRLPLAPGAALTAFASRSLLKNLAYLRRRMARELGAVQCQRHELSEANASGLLERVQAVEAASWVLDKAGDAKFVGERNRRFWSRLAASPGRGWKPVVWLLSAGGQDLAFSAHLEHGETVWIFANGYAEAHAALSPGSLLTEDLLQEALGRHVRLVDWGQGDSGYKGRWGAVAGAAVHDHLMFGPSLAGRALGLVAATRLRGWERQ